MPTTCSSSGRASPARSWPSGSPPSSGSPSSCGPPSLRRSNDAVDDGDSGSGCTTTGRICFAPTRPDVVEYLSRFTALAALRAPCSGQRRRPGCCRIPINPRHGQPALRARAGSAEPEDFLAERRGPVAEVRTGEDAVVARVGRDLYERFFRGSARTRAAVRPRAARRAGPTPLRILDVRASREPRRRGRRRAGPRGPASAPAHPLSRLASDELRGRADELRFACRAVRRLRSRCRAAQRFRLSLRSSERRFRPGRDAESSRYRRDQRAACARTVEYAHPGETAEVSPQRDADGRGRPVLSRPRDPRRELYRGATPSLAERDPEVTFVGRLARFQYLNMDQVTARAPGHLRAGTSTESPSGPRA